MLVSTLVVDDLHVHSLRIVEPLVNAILVGDIEILLTDINCFEIGSLVGVDVGHPLVCGPDDLQHRPKVAAHYPPHRVSCIGS